MFLADLWFSYAWVIPLAVFGVCAAGGWLLMDFFAAQKSRAMERLEELKNPTLRRQKDSAVNKKTAAMTRVLETASLASKPLQPKNEFEASKLRAKLASGGFRSEMAPNVYLGLKFLGLVIGFIASGGAMLIVGGISKNTLLMTATTAGILFFAPDIVLWWLIKRRKQAIFLSLPDTLDLMVVCVEAGLGLDQAMRKVTEEMSGVAPVICEEFNVCNFQLQMGKSRAEVLHELGTRTGVDDLRSLAAILIQADKFGSSVAQALRVQSDSMRTRRRQLAEEKAAKTAVKLIFPLVLFIFPGIFVVLVGPAAIQIVRQMFPAMGG